MSLPCTHRITLWLSLQARPPSSHHSKSFSSSVVSSSWMGMNPITWKCLSLLSERKVRKTAVPSSYWLRDPTRISRHWRGHSPLNLQQWIGNNWAVIIKEGAVSRLITRCSQLNNYQELSMISKIMTRLIKKCLKPSSSHLWATGSKSISRSRSVANHCFRCVSEQFYSILKF